MCADLHQTYGPQGGRDAGTFVRETSSQAVAVHRDLVQSVKSWEVSAPRILEAKVAPDVDEASIMNAWASE